MTDRKDTQPEEEIVMDGEDLKSDDTDLVDEEERSIDKIKALREKLATCEKEKMAHLDELQRTKADFLNSRKRLEEQKRIDVERSVDEFIYSLLPICDSFHMAMSNKKTWESVDRNWRVGIEAINSQLEKLLASYSVTALDPINEHFDPQKHEALGTTEDDNGEPDTVAQVIQPGFSRNGVIIRPAKVLLRK